MAIVAFVLHTRHALVLAMALQVEALTVRLGESTVLRGLRFVGCTDPVSGSSVPNHVHPLFEVFTGPLESRDRPQGDVHARG